MARRFVLASASPARRRLLQAAGVDPEVIVSGVEEDDEEVTDVAAHVADLSRRKAEAVAALPEASGALVLGCDSMLDLGGTGFGKPEDADAAAARWRRMRGTSGHLRTGHHLVDTATGRAAGAVASTEVRFADVSDAEIDAYVATGEPLGVAGAFTIDGRGSFFVEGVDGDHGNVIGVSLPLLRRLLSEVDVAVADLW